MKNQLTPLQDRRESPISIARANIGVHNIIPDELKAENEER